MNLNDDKYDAAFKHVFRFLPFVDKIHCELVCHKWKTIIRELIAQEQEYLIINENLNEKYRKRKNVYGQNDIGIKNNIDSMKALLLKVPNLKKICLGIYGYDFELFDFLSENCPQLVTIVFLEFPFITRINGQFYKPETELDQVFYCNQIGGKLNNSIKHLSLIGLANELMLNALISNLNDLESLEFKLVVCSNINQSLRMNNNSLRKLRLNFRNCKSCLDLIIKLKQFGCSENMTNLHLKVIESHESNEICQICLAICKELGAEYPQLEELTLENIQLIIKNEASYLYKLKKLTCSTSHFSVSFIDANIFGRLKELNLFNVTIGYDVMSFNGISSCCPNLEKISLITMKAEQSQKLTDLNLYSSIFQQISRLNNLKIFIFNNWSADIQDGYEYQQNIYKQELCKILFNTMQRTNLVKYVISIGNIMSEQTINLIIRFALNQPNKLFVFQDKWIIKSRINHRCLIPKNIKAEIVCYGIVMSKARRTLNSIFNMN